MDNRGRRSQTQAMTTPLLVSPEARLRRALAPALLALLAAGCATPMPSPDDRGAITPAALLRGEPITGAVDPAPLPDTDVLGLDEAMRRFVAESVDMNLSMPTRLRQLLGAVIREDHLDIRTTNTPIRPPRRSPSARRTAFPTPACSSPSAGRRG